MNLPRLSVIVLLLAAPLAVVAQEPMPPKETIKLFNGKDFTGLTTWLKGDGRKDPRGVFSVKDGMIHASGEGYGYLATERPWRDYHLTVEYRWGKRTDGGKF